MTSGGNMATELLGVPEDEAVLILAHPASGTRYATEAIRAGYHGEKHVIHERLRPEMWWSRGVRAVISYRIWGSYQKKFDRKWLLTRDPLKTVFSCAGLFRVKSKRAMVMSYMFGDGLFKGPLFWSVLELDPLHGAVLCLLKFYDMADRCGYCRHFRVEDITVDVPAERKNQTHRPKPASWGELMALDNEAATKLRSRAESFGYNY